jgi:hypothetical protein
MQASWLEIKVKGLVLMRASALCMQARRLPLSRQME